MEFLRESSCDNDFSFLEISPFSKTILVKAHAALILKCALLWKGKDVGTAAFSPFHRNKSEKFRDF